MAKAVAPQISIAVIPSTVTVFAVVCVTSSVIASVVLSPAASTGMGLPGIVP